MRPPQSAQNHDVTSAPDGDGRRQPFGLPRTIRKDSVSTGMLSAKALPEAVWHSVQLQV